MSSSVKPNLFVVGASKCGTTFFYSLLQQHPDVCFSYMKEPFFFQRDDYEQKLDWYESLFVTCQDQVIVAEASPNYAETTVFPEVPARIFDYNSTAKIILLVRDPIERLKSVWRQTLSSGHQYRKTFYREMMPKKLEDAVFGYPPMIEARRYYTHVQAYRNVFGKEKVLIVFFEDLIDETLETMKSVTEFLGISAFRDWNLSITNRNQSHDKRRFSPLLNWIRRCRLLRSLHSVVPLHTPFRLLNCFRPRVPSDVDFSPTTMKRIHDELRPEVRELLVDQGKPANYWGIW